MSNLFFVELCRHSQYNCCYWFKIFNNEASAKELYREQLEYEADGKIDNYKTMSNNELCDAIINYIRKGEMVFDYEFFLTCEELEILD